MLLDIIKDFKWENEPYDISFNEEGMLVVTNANSDFWQNAANKIAKNDGHFFYTTKVGDFSCKLCVRAPNFQNFAQSGMMIKINNKNWFKISIMSALEKEPQIGSCLTISGFSDWAIYPLAEVFENIFYKINKKDNNFFVFYSFDDVNYKQVRQFSFVEPLIELKVGAYFASPSNEKYQALLKKVEVK